MGYYHREKVAMEGGPQASRDADAERSEAIVETVRLMGQQFMRCHQFLADYTHRLGHTAA